MIRLFAMILMAPFWVHFLLAGAVLAFGHYSHDAGTKGLAEKMRLAQAAPPPEMAITAFTSDAPRSVPVEMNLRAQIAIGHNVELVKTKNGETVSKRVMYILVAPDAGSDAKLAYGAVILQPSEVDMFSDWVTQKVAENGTIGALGPIFAFDGLRDQPFDTGHIMEALANQGFTAAPNFTYVDPFLKGRAAGLAIKPSDAPLDIVYTHYATGFFVFLGLLKLALRMRRKGQGPRTRAPRATAMPMVEAQGVETAVAPALPALASNDFIGALARKAASSNAAKPVPSPSLVVSKAGLGARLGGKMRKLAGFGGLLAVYVMFANFGGAFNIPSVETLKGVMGLKPAMTEFIMTEAAPVPAPLRGGSGVPVAVSQGQPAQGGEATPQAATVAPTPSAVVAAVRAVPLAPVADNQPGMQAKAAKWIAAAKAQFAEWRTAPPMWVWASLLAAITAMPTLYVLRKLPTLGRKGASKPPKLDPYERLLQLRLAENALGQKAVQGGTGLLRA